MRLLTAALLLTASLPAATIPRPAPEFSFVALGGKTISLDQYKGKVVVLEIMSTTCPHCQDSAKVLSRLNAELGPKGFQPLAVAVNDGADVGAFVRTYGVNFPIGTATQNNAFALAQHSVLQGPFYFPTMLFIDRKGQIRAQYNGTQAFLSTNEESNIRSLVNTLLAEPTPSAKPAAVKSGSAKKAS
jgi:peroxiredoxin